MKLKSFLVVFSLLFIIWLILNSSLSLEYIISGAVISALIALLFCRECSVLNDFRFTPWAFLNTFLFLAVFFWELVKSNFDIAWRVLSPSLPINPGIIKVRTVLKSKMARLILANSITLTPGTFTIDIIGDDLFIHCVNINDEDPEVFGQRIVKKFEKYLEEIYG